MQLFSRHAYQALVLTGSGRAENACDLTEYVDRSPSVVSRAAPCLCHKRVEFLALRQLRRRVAAAAVAVVVPPFSFAIGVGAPKASGPTAPSAARQHQRRRPVFTPYHPHTRSPLLQPSGRFQPRCSPPPPLPPGQQFCTPRGGVAATGFGLRPRSSHLACQDSGGRQLGCPDCELGFVALSGQPNVVAAIFRDLGGESGTEIENLRVPRTWKGVLFVGKDFRTWCCAGDEGLALRRRPCGGWRQTTTCCVG